MREKLFSIRYLYRKKGSKNFQNHSYEKEKKKEKIEVGPHFIRVKKGGNRLSYKLKSLEHQPHIPKYTHT